MYKITRNNKIVLLLSFIFGVLFCFLNSCKSDKENNQSVTTKDKEQHDVEKFVKIIPEPEIKDTKPKPTKKNEVIPQGWVEITPIDGIVIDIKYAEDDNFTKKKIYDCGRCFLRPEATSAIKNIHQKLKSSLGYGLKIFDCFRPQPYQEKLWDAVPNPDYVTPPNKGSMHSRGLAVDLTLVDQNGVELDMGTPFDFFGKEAHQDYKGHSSEINKNRNLLKSTMEKHGFKSIRTEWWHYSYQSKSYPLDPWVWECL